MAHFVDFLATLYCEFVLDRLVHALRSRRMQMDTTGGGEVQPCFSSLVLLIRNNTLLPAEPDRGPAVWSADDSPAFVKSVAAGRFPRCYLVRTIFPVLLFSAYNRKQ
jgi:hypothetical protein